MANGDATAADVIADLREHPELRDKVTTLPEYLQKDPAVIGYLKATEPKPVTGPMSLITTDPAWAERIKQNALPVIGSTIGAAGGALTPVPGGASIGAGLGSMVGEAATAALRGQDMPSAQDLGWSGLLTGAVDAATRGTGRGLIWLGRELGMLPTPAPGAARTAEAFRETGTPMKVTDVNVARGPAMWERYVQHTIMGQPPLSQTLERQAAALRTAAEDFFESLGRPLAGSKTGTGAALADAIETNAGRFRQAESRAWDRVAEQATQNGTQVDVAPLVRVARPLLEQELRKLPGQQNQTLIRQLQAVVNSRWNPDFLDFLRRNAGGYLNFGPGGVPSDPKQLALAMRLFETNYRAPAQISGGQVPWETVRAWQKAWGQTLSGDTGLLTDAPRGAAKALWGGATSSLEGAARGTPLEAAFGQARALSERGNELFRDSTLSRILTMPPEQVSAMLRQGGPTAVRNFKDALLGDPNLMFAHAPGPAETDAWNLFRRHVFEGIFSEASEGGVVTRERGIAGAVVNGVQLEKRLGKMGPEVLNQLLSPTEQHALDNIARVATAIKEGERIGSSRQSITGTLTGMRAITALPGAIGGFMVGHPAMGAMVSAALTPPALAHALTDPRFAALVASPGFTRFTENLARTGVMTREGVALLGRVAAIAASAPSPQPRALPGVTAQDPLGLRE